MATRRRLRAVPFLHRATHRVALFLEAARPPLGLSQGEAHLLAHLHEEGPRSVGELHRAFAHKRSSLTSYLDRLEARGLVARSTHPDDRRSFLVTLTRRGAPAAARAQARLLELEETALAGVSASDVRAFARVAEALAEAAVGI